jgi:hypothetical protein
MAVTQVENVSWFSRIMESIRGVAIGLLLFVISLPLLFWNEGRAVHRARTLAEGRGAVVEATAETVDPAQEGMLVHLVGTATATTPLVDPQNQVQAPPGSLRLQRTVEMYQWRERSESKRQRSGGGGERRSTRYTYEQTWSSTALDSSRFEQPEGHQNPPMPMQGASFDAMPVVVGARALTPALTGQIDNFQPLPVQAAQVPQLGMQAGGRPVSQSGEWIYLGANPNVPMVGDVRVRWQVAPSTEVSILAGQAGPSFGSWTSDSGNTLEQNLAVGRVSADDMFTGLEAGNTYLTWGLRFLGWFLGFIGLTLVFRPMVVVADVVPFLGGLVGAGASLASFVIATPLALFTMAVAWLFYRPLVGLALLCVGFLIMGGLGFLVHRLASSRNAKRREERQGGGGGMGGAFPQPQPAGFPQPGGGFAPPQPGGGFAPAVVAAGSGAATAAGMATAAAAAGVSAAAPAGLPPAGLPPATPRASPSRATPSKASPSRATPSRAGPSRAIPSRASPSRGIRSRGIRSRRRSRATRSRATRIRAIRSRGSRSRAIHSSRPPNRATRKRRSGRDGRRAGTKGAAAGARAAAVNPRRAGAGAAEGAPRSPAVRCAQDRVMPSTASSTRSTMTP